MKTYIIIPYTHKIKRDVEMTTSHTDFIEYLKRLQYLSKHIDFLMGVEIKILDAETFETQHAYIDSKKFKDTMNHIIYGK